MMGIDNKFELNLLFENMLEGVIVQNIKGEIIFFNKKALQILSMTEDQLRGKTSMDSAWRAIREDGSNFPGEEHPVMISLRTGKECRNVIMGIEVEIGNRKWITINSFPIFKPDTKEVEKSVVVFNEITEMHKLSEELELKNSRMQMAMEALNFGVWDWDLKNDVLIWDDSMYKIFGISKSDFSKAYEAFNKLLAPGESEKVQKELDESFKNKTDYHGEFKINKSSGEKRLIKAASKAYYDNDGKISRLVGANWDITELRSNEMKLLQNARMSTLGEMSAGIAHEINNPLSIISGYMEVLNILIKKGEVDKLQDPINKINSAVDRVSKIVKSLSTFSKQDLMDEKKVTDFQKVFDESEDLFQQRLKNKGINLQVINNSKSKIKVNSIQISQIIVNLIINSIQALETIGDKWIKIDVIENNNYIEAIFTDSGKGVSEGIVNKLFDPFYTTKDIGVGTGLGLSISKGIAEKHGGSLEYKLDSPNTTFILKLPIHKQSSY